MYPKRQALSPAKIAVPFLALILSACGGPLQEEVPPTETPSVELQGGLEGGLPPGGVAYPGSPVLVAPTRNLTRVANAFTLRHKSLTTALSVAPGLTLTRPVEISIGYYSPAGTKRITQSYVAGSGNRFLYNDPAGDGNPRRLRMDVTLSEPKTGGGVTTFAFTMQTDLDPLYDISVSPLTFTLLTDCDLVGNSEIEMWWWLPDQSEDDKQRASFSMSAGESVVLGRFVWGRSEVSVTESLHLPNFNFWEWDPRIKFVPSNFLPLPPNLVPGQTHTVETVIDEGSSEKQCSAAIKYTLTYTLRWYPHL